MRIFRENTVGIFQVNLQNFLIHHAKGSDKQTKNKGNEQETSEQFGVEIQEVWIVQKAGPKGLEEGLQGIQQKQSGGDWGHFKKLQSFYYNQAR